MNKHLISLANKLDLSGFYSEANIVDQLIRIANDEDSETESETVDSDVVRQIRNLKKLEELDNLRKNRDFKDLPTQRIDDDSELLDPSTEPTEIIELPRVGTFIKLEELQSDIMNSKKDTGVKSKIFFDMTSNARGQLENKPSLSNFKIDYRDAYDVLSFIIYALKLDSNGNYSSIDVKQSLLFGKNNRFKENNNPYMNNKEEFLKSLPVIFDQINKNHKVGLELAEFIGPYLEEN